MENEKMGEGRVYVVGIQPSLLLTFNF
jgi:hypothetical protein